MAPSATKRCVLAHSGRFARRHVRNLAVRAAVLEAPNAVPEELAAEAADMQSMYAQFDELLSNSVTTFNAGDQVRGTVVDVNRKGALIDIGGKGAAFAAVSELTCAPVVDVRSENSLTKRVLIRVQD
jgi:hypothetical protein